MKRSQVVSTTALVLGSLMVATATQTTVHADNGGQATDTEAAQLTANSAASQKETQASQAVTSYATSQGVVASQAASQADTNTQSYASQLESDPAKTAEQERQEAAKTQSTADVTADATLNDAKSDASKVQSQAVQDAKSDKVTADSQASDTKTASEKQAQATKNKADSDASTAKKNADTQASATKDAEIKQAQSGKVDGKYTTNVTNAQNKLKSDQSAVDKANADATTAYTATPTNDNSKSEIGNHDIQSEKNLPITLIDPKLSSSQSNSTNSDDLVDYYGGTLKNDNSTVITGDLTDSQQKELADYAITLVNSWRKAQGLNPIIWTQQAQDATVEVTKMREKNNLGSKHTMSDSATFKELNQLASNKGINYEQENLGYVDSFHDKFTMGLLKVKILNEITNMIYQDAFSNWGHKSNFENMQYMGFAVQHNTSITDGSLFPYVLVFDGYALADSDSLTKSAPVTQTVLTPTSAQTIEASRTSGGATQSQLQAVANDKIALANAQKALADATNAVNQSIASQLSAINDKYTKQLQANTDVYQAKLTQNDTNYKNAIASAEKTYADTLTANASNEATKIAQAKTNYDTAVAKAQSAHDAAIKQAQDTYDTAYANAHDETPAERAARHADMLTAFKASEDAKLVNLKTQQATDLAAFKATQDKLVADYLASQKTNNQIEPKPVPSVDDNVQTSQQNTTQANDQIKTQKTAISTGHQTSNSQVSLRTSSVNQPVSVILPTANRVHDAKIRQTASDETTALPQTSERRHGASASLLGLMLLSLSGFGYSLLRRKHGKPFF